MFLKRIELQGFKSFADKTVIQFDHDITGIVGPNGCGKSNINDAIRWVLGEQSVKSLRSGNNMSDIIFSGSEQRKKVNIARVSLVFDNTSHIFDSEYEELEITRQIQRSNNEASYFINKTPCRLKDINDLVMDTGLGRDSLSIISQGNISSFADAKPEERRSLFEEAAGVSKYKKRKKVSLQKLEHTKDNLDRLQDIIDELERQLSPLERQAKKARQYLEYKNELSDIEISVLVDEIETYDQKIKELEQQLFETKTLYTSKEAELLKQEQEIDTWRKEVYQLDAQISKAQQEYTHAMEENYQLEKRKVELDEKRKYTLQMANQKEKIAALQKMVEEARFEYEDRKTRYENTKAELNLHNQKLNDYQRKLQNINMEVRQNQDMYQQLLNRKQVIENMMKQPFQHQAGVRSIMQAKNSLRGIEGVVSELLISQPDKANAISNALGGSMYQIVTKDEVSARQAIGFLKKNRSGRATFLPLTVCKPKFASSQQDFIAIQSPGAIGWASHCVECHPRYNNVRDRLLGNIFVVDTLENANECAKRLNYAIKIVTLGGDVVHAGGAMSGGAVKNQSTPITLKQEMNTILSQLEGQEMKLNCVREEQHTLQINQMEENERCVQLQIELAKLENIYSVKKEKYESLKAEYTQMNPDAKPEENIGIVEDELVVQMSKMHARIDELTSSMQTLRTRRLNQGKVIEEAENQVRRIRREMQSLQQELHRGEVVQTQWKTKQENALMRLNADYQMTFEFAQTKKKDIDVEWAKDRVQELRASIAKLGNVNLDAPKEFEEVKERYDFLQSQKEDLELASKQILDAIDEMDQTMISQFSEMFDKINNELDGIFKAMFGGGKARLKMVDPDDILNTGIDIDVQPPGKLIKNIQTFSGGEKALIAISVLFAILKARTMPLCIFDEVEAALDQANVERFARYLSHFKGQSQFIVVTHRPGTMEQCDSLYGVTMQKDGVSQILKVLLKDAVSYVEKEGE